MIDRHDKNVEKIAKALLKELNKFYPEIIDNSYCSMGFPDKEGSPSLDRAKFCIYVELLKAGAFKNDNR